jgi:UDPglucose 6-dehydrogenase
MVIGIVGLGVVGTAVFEGMRLHHDVHGYDIDGRGDWNRIMKSDALFICVPTDGTAGGELDSGIVEEVVSRISESKFEGLAIVKSTLQPGTMSRLKSLFPTVRIVYMPEFLREKDAKEWFQNPDRLVAAGSPGDVDEAWGYFEWVPQSTPRMVMSGLEAEIGKIAHNSFIATKVTFTCEVERLCKTFDADPRPVMEVVWRDRRVQNPAHLTPGLGGFDGKCIPKDTRALRSLDVDTPLLDTVCETGSNEVVKKKMSSISSKSINPTNEGGLRKRIEAFLSNLFSVGIITLLLIPLIFVLSVEMDDHDYHIITPQGSLVDMEIGDHITILDVNSSIIDSEIESEEHCYHEFDSYSSDCYYSQTHHLTLVYTIGEITYELSSNDFVEDCFGNKCSSIGEVVRISGEMRWIEVRDYHVI